MVKMRSAEVMCTHIFAGVFTHRYQPLRLQQLPHELPLQETLRVHQDSGRAAHGVFCGRLSRAQCTHQGQAFSMLCALCLLSPLIQYTFSVLLLLPMILTLIRWCCMYNDSARVPGCGGV